MKLIYIDPNCSGLQVQDCKSEKQIKKVLAEQGIDKNNCSDCIYYVFISKDGTLTEGTVDFS